MAQSCAIYRCLGLLIIRKYSILSSNSMVYLCYVLNSQFFSIAPNHVDILDNGGMIIIIQNSVFRLPIKKTTGQYLME